ncbi:S24 family peptidase [Azoarcus sp. PA01]|nr:S24 family peptidase [Azoarcus sp. PA01]
MTPDEWPSGLSPLPEAARRRSSPADPSHPEEANICAGPDRKGKVPLISWVRAGEFAHAADLLPVGEAYEWVETGVNVQPHTFALRVQGDSMEPEFVAGTIIVIEPQMVAEPGDYVIARNGDNEATFKQLVRDGADLYLKPLNPRYPIKPLGATAIIGVVREAVKRYR